MFVQPSTTLFLSVSVESHFATLLFMLSDPAILEKFSSLNIPYSHLTFVKPSTVWKKSSLCPDNSFSFFSSWQKYYPSFTGLPRHPVKVNLLITHFPRAPKCALA